MKRNKTELRLTLLKIFGYVIIMSLFESIWGDRSGELGRVLIAGLILLVLALDMRRRGEHFSEAALSELPYRKLLYLLPMIAVATANLWHGAVLRFSVWDTVCYIAAMLIIGVIEELLFRGYLLRLHWDFGMSILVLGKRNLSLPSCRHYSLTTKKENER